MFVVYLANRRARWNGMIFWPVRNGGCSMIIKPNSSEQFENSRYFSWTLFPGSVIWDSVAWQGPGMFVGYIAVLKGCECKLALSAYMFVGCKSHVRSTWSWILPSRSIHSASLARNPLRSQSVSLSWVHTWWTSVIDRVFRPRLVRLTHALVSLFKLNYTCSLFAPVFICCVVRTTASFPSPQSFTTAHDTIIFIN